MKKLINDSGKVLNVNHLKDLATILTDMEKNKRFKIGAYTELGENNYYSFLINEDYNILLLRVGNIQQNTKGE